MESQIQSRPTGWPATQVAWLSRQLLLVPEAVLLLTLLCLHTALGASPLLALLGLLLIVGFATRMSLLYMARHAVEVADYPRAEQLASMALGLYPFSADAHALRGVVHMARGNAAAAVASLDRAVHLYPFEAGLHTALSAALLEDGRPSEALAEAMRAIALNPACAPAYLHQASAEELLAGDSDTVETHLRAGLEQPALPADEAALRCALAALLLRAGRVSEAQLALAGTERLLLHCSAPQRAGLHYHLGDLLRQIGDPDGARGHFNASERLDPHGRYAAAAWRAARS